MRFQVRALQHSGDIVSVSVDAASPEAAVRLAAVAPADVVSVRLRSSWQPWARARRLSFPVLLFSQELLALLAAGLGVVEAMEALVDKEQRAEVRDTLLDILRGLQEGQTLSLALEGAGAAFPPLFVATVRASEKTGALADALGRYIGYQAQLDGLRKKIVSASIYPALLLVVGGLVVLFLLGYVVPRFASVYEGSPRALPLLSRLLLDWGTLLQSHAAAILAVVLLVMGVGFHAVSRPGTRAELLRALWRIPALGERMHAYQLARFYRALGMLLRGGIPLAQGLAMVSDILPPALRARVGRALDHIRQGRSVSQAMEAADLATPVALRMLRVGERAGNMGEMMDRIAAFHDDEMARWVDWATRLFEPILMAVIGLVIGLIVILMYLPIFELAGSLE